MAWEEAGAVGPVDAPQAPGSVLLALRTHPPDAGGFFPHRADL